MSSVFGNKLKVSVFGQSHGAGIGVVVDGFPAGEQIDMDRLDAFMARRRPGGKHATKRRESDRPRFLSGIEDSKTCGFPLCVVIDNEDTRSKDYKAFGDTPRPSHADYTAFVKYGGNADMRGGGHFSGRLTAPLCAAGGIAIQILEKRGIKVGAHLLMAAGLYDLPFDPVRAGELDKLEGKEFPCINDAVAEKIKLKIEEAAAQGDSIGGIIECAIVGLPAGVGEPMFGGIENRLASAVFGIPAIKGVEFGAGFACASMRGSQNNDPFEIKDGRVMTRTNNHGGSLGGISSGMPIILRAAVKPTPSILIEQDTVRLSAMVPAKVQITGRHDPCVALRAVPCIEAVCALTVLDMLIEDGRI